MALLVALAARVAAAAALGLGDGPMPRHVVPLEGDWASRRAVVQAGWQQEVLEDNAATAQAAAEEAARQKAAADVEVKEAFERWAVAGDANATAHFMVEKALDHQARAKVAVRRAGQVK